MKKQSKNSDSLKITHDEILGGLWPAIKGSLALVHKPCIRKNCPLCLSGKKHPAHILSYNHNGKRRCMYVPKDVVPLIEQALENGRAIEQWLCEQGPILIHDYRAKRDTKRP
jgi:hypothetical protein